MVLDANDNTEKQVTTILYMWDENGGTLTNDAHLLMQQIRQALNSHLAQAKTSRDKSAEEMQGCIDRLNAFLLQVSRIAKHANPARWSMGPVLTDLTKLQPGSCAAFPAMEACADFESLLFHGRAVLDRLTLFVSREHGKNSDRFSKLENLLKDLEKKDTRAGHVLNILGESKSIPGVLTDIAGDKALRSMVAHRSSIAEGTTIVFMVWRLFDGQILAFDSEALGYPVINTAALLAADIPFVVLTTLCLYGSVGAPMARSTFEGIWKNTPIIYSHYLSGEEAGLLIPSAKMIPDAVRLGYNHLKADIMQHAIPFETFLQARANEKK